MSRYRVYRKQPLGEKEILSRKKRDMIDLWPAVEPVWQKDKGEGRREGGETLDPLCVSPARTFCSQPKNTDKSIAGGEIW